MSTRVTAQRYAKALFELSLEKDAMEQIRADLTNLTLLIDASPEWRTFVREPSGPKSLREKAIFELLKPKCHQITANFIALLDHRSRLPLLEIMVEEWMALYDRHQGIIRATVLSAVTLTAQQKDALTEKLSQRYDHRVVIDARVDASLIGGIRILIGDQVYDYSVESQLQQLQKRLIFAT
ncbi:MAG: ATP synthase F1 subunit delta [Kiritimatiellia bacterium]|jgi:F-type H+-transporting ATPase subunit delta